MQSWGSGTWSCPYCSTKYSAKDLGNCICLSPSLTWTPVWAMNTGVFLEKRAQVGKNRNWYRPIVLPKHEGKGQQLGSLLKVIWWVQPFSTPLSLNAVPCISFMPWLTSSHGKDFVTKCQGRLVKPWTFFNKSWSMDRWISSSEKVI